MTVTKITANKYCFYLGFPNVFLVQLQEGWKLLPRSTTILCTVTARSGCPPFPVLRLCKLYDKNSPTLNLKKIKGACKLFFFFFNFQREYYLSLSDFFLFFGHCRDYYGHHQFFFFSSFPFCFSFTFFFFFSYLLSFFSSPSFVLFC